MAGNPMYVSPFLSLGSISPSVQAMQNRPPPVAPDESGLAKGIRSAPPPGFPPDLPTPEELSSADAVVAEPLVELLGEYVTTCLFAKNWQLREAGMQMIERSLNEGRLPKGANPRDELRQLTKVVCWALKDKVGQLEEWLQFACKLGTR